MSNYGSPGRAAASAAAWITGGVIALVIIGALIIGGWQAGWWFTQQNATRTAHLIQHGYANQATLQQVIGQDYQDITSLATTRAGLAPSDPLQRSLRSQQLADLTDLCFKANQIDPANPLPVPLARIVKANCLAGAHIASPPLANPVPR